MDYLKEAIYSAEDRQVAIGHFNISELAALRAITRAATELRVPVIIGTSEGEAEFIGMKQAAALILSLREESRYPIFLNADHMRELDKVKEAVEAGYDSVIFDGANLPFEDNIKKTKEAVELAKSITPTVLIEGEVGYIGTSSKLLDEVPEGAAVSEEDMTTPEEAERFVKETGVDLLAPAVGEIHGMVRSGKNPNLDIERIKKIRKAAGVPLVLHGGSGTTDEDFVKAIKAGISVIHINTEIRVAWRRGLEGMLKEDAEEIAPYRLLSDPGGKFTDPEEEVYKVVLKRLRLFNRLT
ncbi:MAG: tagatose-bisphosphate aldolase [Candidatus Colwellbacteria bacterium RIFCSPHIGHO2_02_FULL_45_17]|uniref:Tagatose-bisphosphate aldolase n=2 Tax=Candidatus Colwelliibacteriota TaxID=1817904 RepID=A0A1G1ZDD8_9BACT|nr:MAG: tagatose-bisphosphate aldolase [Candidatus Colwellbacteria bacterium RIFCSPHIGHO2_02_FULL_45_17]OGY60860.1 MAG: tagatose-bisphosphate aldolase [Candidatus Colwellbacteria bacterium RIFCSPLOWO2_02_FULL_45_11]OGY62632.1 MAG: tagatose-bisphosphate aldolase [Candidatus Colwellbacteria bacterium RIFCSPLOWO2_12_FULL_46_17]